MISISDMNLPMNAMTAKEANEKTKQNRLKSSQHLLAEIFNKIEERVKLGKYELNLYYDDIDYTLFRNDIAPFLVDIKGYRVYYTMDLGKITISWAIVS